MPRRKDISEILELMKKTERIRNIGFVGHIDHGKTTLSDSLLSEAGLLNPELAGEARVLDYLEEEQQRGITMKSTNISLYYESPTEKKEPFLVNLVDTPGHLDFSGKVTRALRLIDGVVVVVDAVEEIISQSETVIRQAIEEGVKPVLYINKVDRLIRELKLNDEEIRKKYSRIINDFNKLIERFADPPFDKKWQVSPKDGNVAFGSALHKWGFTLKLLHESGLKFKDIRSRYKKETYSKDTYADLSVFLPIHSAILEMVVNFLPNPIDAQKYRIKKIWNGDLSSEIGQSMENCNPEGPLAICVSKVQADKHGLVATGRIFSGTCSVKDEIFITKQNNFDSIQRLAIFMGQRREQVNRIPVGNVIALEGIREVKSGETIVEKDSIESMVPFGNVKYITTPVVTVSIEPEYLRDLDEMKSIIMNLLVEDPNLKFDINEDTGEFLLSGMGPLHLEVTANEIKKRGVEVSISEPHAVYKESCRYKSSIIRSSNPSNKNFVELSIERLNDKTASFFRKSDHQSIKPISKLKEILQRESSLEAHEIEHFWNCDEDQNLLIYEGEKEIDDFLKSLIIEIMDKIHLNGPLCGEKLTEIKFIVRNLNISEFDEETAFTEVSMIFYDAIKRGLQEAEPILLEPIYNTIIQLPPEYVKKAVSLLSKFSAKIKLIDQENEYQAKVEILLPVRHSIKFAEDLRSITSGKAFWQNEFHSFMEVPPSEANRIISNLKFKKGLSW